MSNENRRLAAKIVVYVWLDDSRTLEESEAKDEAVMDIGLTTAIETEVNMLVSTSDALRDANPSVYVQRDDP